MQRVFAILNSPDMMINLNDILSEKLMPMSILYIEGSKYGNIPTSETANPNSFDNFTSLMVHSSSVGDKDSAFSLMQFHR